MAGMASTGRGTKAVYHKEGLVISTSTVQFHVHNILGKLGVRTRTEAVAVAIQSKLIGP